MPAPEPIQTTGAKSVFGRWLKDLRPTSREAKVHHPLGRTLSANVKDKERKKKISRSLSANQKDRKKDYRELYGNREDFGDLERSTGRRYRTIARDEVDGTWEKQENLKRIFGSDDGDGSRRRYYENGQAINRSALVSYLDEDGLNGVEVRRRSSDGCAESKSRERNYKAKQDGAIMPTSSLQQQKSKTNHYENHENIVLNERNQLKSGSGARSDPKKQSDYSRIEYLKYKHEVSKSSYNYYNSNHDLEHKYENLKKPWESEKPVDPKEEGNAEEEDSLISIKNLENLVESNRECSFQFGYGDGCGVGDRSRCQDVPEAPVRDPSSLKSIKYGPGHEKYPSWPGSVRTEGGEKPQRSHSWTDQTSYPKEKVTTYVRPYSMRANPAFTQQLKTVMERCEKISPETFQKTMEHMEERENRLYLPRVDREGKSLGDQDYMVPSPPERDKPALTQADLEKYYQENHHMTKIDNGDYSTPYEDIRKGPQLTRADLEEYARSYDEVLKPHHQHQGSYAQSEGYHSYVSSSELTTTPFLDRLRRESDSGIRNQQWDEDGRAGRDSVVTTSSGSASSSETLKWHGSMSDVSVASSSCRSRQLIAHSSRVPPPQRHHSESVLYLGNQNSGQNGSNWQSKTERSQQLKLFPVNTYTVQPNEQSKPVISPTSVPQMSVAERISELERQQQAQRFAYLDPDKRHRVSDPTLKAIQKKALLSFYERHQHSNVMGSGAQPAKGKENWKSEPQLVANQEAQQRGAAPPPPPRPAIADQPNKRGSCASDLSVGSWGKPSHQFSCSLLGPVIVGPSISVDDWVPERPPKKPHLRTVPPPIPQRTPSPVQVPPADHEVESLHAYHKFLPCYDRMPTPDLPPPPPPPPQPEEDSSAADEPLPPPPPEIEWHLATAVPRRTTPMSSGPASPQSPGQYPPAKDCFEVAESAERPSDHGDTLGALLMSSNEVLKSAYEIQYDQNAINAIMESNRLSKELHKRKYQSKHRDHDQEKSRSHTANRPPLPLPRDVQESTDRVIRDGCESVEPHWAKPNEKSKSEGKKSISQALESNPNSPFVRNFPRSENGSARGSGRHGKNESNSRSSLRYPSKKLVVNGHAVKERLSPERLQRTLSATEQQPPVAPKTAKPEMRKPFAVKKVSEYESRIPIRDRDGLSVFERRFVEEKATCDARKNVAGHQPIGSNSKAAFLAVRREKELGLMNFEGSYKLTMTPSGESIESRNSEKAPLEIVKMKEKSTENLVLDNRLSLEPPDLIPKIGNLNRKASSVQDVRETAKKYAYNRFSNEKYRLLPSYQNNNNTVSSNNINNSSNNRVSCENIRIQSYGVQNESRTIAEDVAEGDRYRRSSADAVRAVPLAERAVAPEPQAEKKSVPVAYRSSDAGNESAEDEEEEEEADADPDGDEDEDEEDDRRGVGGDEDARDDKNYGVSFAVREIEVNERMEREKVVTLQRVLSAQEKRVTTRNGTVERSKSLKLVERSTSFGRTDTMKVVQRPESSGTGAAVSDAASQTEEEAAAAAAAGATSSSEDPKKPSEGREAESEGEDAEDADEAGAGVVDETTQRKMAEELEYERLSRDLASQLSPSDKLQGLLVPDSERKKPTDYVAGLFRLDIAARPRGKRTGKKSKSTESDASTSSSSGSSGGSDALVNGSLDCESERAVEALPPSSPYFTTSEPKAKMLTRYTESLDSLGLRDSQQLQKKKEELMARLDKKLEVLRKEQLALLDECSANEELGTSVANSVAKLARPHEAAKYRLHVEEVGKITSLLLGLSGRLARAENALLGLPVHHEERKIHETKRDKLQEQLEEAKQLKESIDKRSDSIAKTLGKCLGPEEYADYLHFIQMKAKLIVDSREIADKISLGEEQLAALRETLSS